jgi:hypothetical protein
MRLMGGVDSAVARGVIDRFESPMLTLQSGKKLRVFRLGPDTRLRADKKTAVAKAGRKPALSDLRRGAPVQILYDPSNQAALEIKFTQ